MTYKNEQSNISKVIKTVRNNKRISRAEISRITRLSKPTVSSIIRRLINANVIVEVGKHRNKKIGKNPVLLTFNPFYKLVLSLDIGGTNFRIALLDLDGNILDKKIYSSSSIKDETTFLNMIKKAVTEILNESSVEFEDILGIGIGIPGTVDARGVVRYIPAFNISDFDLKTELKKFLEIEELIIENDVTLQTVGEMWKGAAKGSKNVFCISIGTGIGGGFVINGNIYSGSHGMAGEIGYSVTDYSVDKNREIKDFGALEIWASGNTFEKLSKKLKTSVKEIFQRYRENDEKIKEIVDNAMEHVGAAIANVISLIDPEMVIFAGGIGTNQFETIIDTILRVIKKFVPKEIVSEIDFKKAVLGDDGVLIGGCYEVQRNFLLKDLDNLKTKL